MNAPVTTADATKAASAIDTTRPATVLGPENTATIAHLNLLQAIITRLAGNSASCKTWCLTLVTAFLSLAGTMKNPALVGAALIPVVLFGFIDTMYLATEKAYRELYNRVVAKINAGAYTVADTFDSRAPLDFAHLRAFAFSAFKSWAIWPVYLGLIGLYFYAVYFTHALEWLTKP
jgi:hypothetical protein